MQQLVTDYVPSIFASFWTSFLNNSVLSNTLGLRYQNKFGISRFSLKGFKNMFQHIKKDCNLRLLFKYTANVFNTGDETR